MSNVGAIVLAAGSSSRLGRAKQLLPFRGGTLIRHAVAAAIGSRLETAVLVLGANADPIAKDVLDLDIENRVVSGLAPDDSEDVFGVNADGLGVFECPINDGGNQSGNTRTARFIFAAAGARLRRHDCIESQLLISLIPQVRFGNAEPSRGLRAAP